jgi:hypothetical protein
MLIRDYSHPALEPFAAAADAFCRVVANADSLAPYAQLHRLHALLPVVYASALRLPPTSVLFQGAHSPDEGKPAVLGAARGHREGLSRLAEFLGKHVFYRDIFDPYADQSELEGAGYLLGDIEEIHDDLQRGLQEWRDGNAAGALWEWRFGFETHWSRHASSALKALAALCALGEISWPTEAG